MLYNYLNIAMSQPITLNEVLNEDFFALVGLQNLAENEKTEILTSMNETVLARAYLRFTQLLQPEQVTHLDSLSVNDFFPYLEEQGIDATAIVMEEALKYRVEVVGLFSMTHPPLVAA